jgi:hypothetical protein
LRKFDFDISMLKAKDVFDLFNEMYFRWSFGVIATFFDGRESRVFNYDCVQDVPLYVRKWFSDRGENRYFFLTDLKKVDLGIDGKKKVSRSGTIRLSNSVRNRLSVKIKTA